MQRLDAANLAQRGITRGDSLVVVEAKTDNAVVLSLVGDLDLAGAPRFVSEAADVLRHGCRALVLDLAAVPFVDSAGLAALLNVLRRATAVKAKMVITGVDDRVRMVFERTRLDVQFRFAATQADAERLVAAA
jgi:anti-anti-sigma factor